MPISKRNNKWYWGSNGPFDSRKKAETVAQAAHASGYKSMQKLMSLVKNENEYSFDEHWMDRAHLPGGPLEPEAADKLKREIAQYEGNLKDGVPMSYSNHAYHHNNAAILHNHQHDLEYPQDQDPRNKGKPYKVEDSLKMNPILEELRRKYQGEGQTGLGRKRQEHRDRLAERIRRRQPTEDEVNRPAVEPEDKPPDPPSKVRLGHAYDVDSLEDMDKKHGEIDIETFHNLINHPYRHSRERHPSKGNPTRTEPFKVGPDISTPGAMMHNTLNNRFAGLWNVNNESENNAPPSEGRFKAIQNMLTRILKEGDGGAGINSLNGVVFTSDNAGIFTETHGGNRKVARKRRKAKRRQDKKRKEILGKDKKNGVEKFDAFIRENSPLNKAVNRRMDGNPNTPPRGAENLRRVEYKKTSKNYGVDKDNTPNSSMSGLNGKIDASSASPDTLADDVTISRQAMPARPQWNDRHVLQQATMNMANIGPQPNQNTQADPPKFVERGKDSTKIAQDADIKMGDFMTRVKKYEDEDAGIEQPLGAASAASKTIQNQISAWGSDGSVERDENKRGGENDKIDSELNEYFDESESAEIIEEIKRLQDKKKKHEEKGMDNSLFLAMMNDE